MTVFHILSFLSHHAYKITQKDILYASWDALKNSFHPSKLFPQCFFFHC